MSDILGEHRVALKSVTATGVSMITPYRREGGPTIDGPGATGLGWYSYELCRELALGGVPVDVIAPATRAEPTWSDDRVTVRPSYRRGSALVARDLYAAAASSPFRVVHLQHELYAYSGAGIAFSIPPALRAIRRGGRKIVTTVHGVIPLHRIDETFVRSNSVRLPPALVRSAWRSLIAGVCGASDVVHVHETEHAEFLRDQYGVRTRIETFPIGTDASAPPRDRARSRAELGIAADAHVVLFFGFLLERKGIVPFLEAAAEMLAADERLVIVLAGAVPDRTADASAIESLLAEASPHERVIALGFVPEERVPSVFAASDVLMLPYVISIAASGPMSLAIGHGVPLLLSTTFDRSYPEAPDRFEPTRAGIAAAVARFFNDTAASERGKRYVQRLRDERSWPAVARWMEGLYASLV